jgi:hypothetical protein
MVTPLADDTTQTARRHSQPGDSIHSIRPSISVAAGLSCRSQANAWRPTLLTSIANSPQVGFSNQNVRRTAAEGEHEAQRAVVGMAAADAMPVRPRTHRHARSPAAHA